MSGITATFNADFRPFKEQLADVAGNLKTLEVSTKGLSGQFTRMAQSFSGNNIKREAEVAAAAVEKIGGVSKLTEAQQRKLSATVTEALAQYRALGEQAPAHLVKLANATKQTESSFGGLKTALAGAVGGFAIFSVAQSAVGAIAGAFKWAAGTALEMNASLEKTTLQFTTLMGDSAKAREHVKGLFEFAKATPFETGPIIEASKQMQVFGGEALNTKANLTLIGDAAAATGAPIEQVGTWVGRLYASLAAGKPIGEAAQRLTELAVIGPQARTALEQVANSGKSVEEKFRVMQDALGQFSGAMALQAKTWDGVMATLADTVNMTLADAFRGFFEVARDSLNQVATIISDGQVEAALTRLGTAISELFGTSQTSQVEGFTNVLVSFADGTIRVAEVVTRAFGSIMSTALEVGAAVTGTVAQVIDSYAKLAEVSDALTPNALSDADETAAWLRETAEGWREKSAAIADAAEKATRAAGGNSELVLSLRQLRTALADAAGGVQVFTQEWAEVPLDAANFSLAGMVKGVRDFNGGVSAAAKPIGDLSNQTKALVKAMDDLTGRSKVVAMEAMAKAIEKAGGFSKVLATEYGKVHQTFTEGIVAAEHLGVTVPTAFVDIARATQNWNAELGKALDTVKLLSDYLVPGSAKWQLPVPQITMPTDGIPIQDLLNLGYIQGAQIAAPNQAFLDEAAAIWTDFVGGISTSLSDMLVGLRSWKEGLKDLWRSALTAVSDIIAAGIGRIVNSLGQKLFQALGPQGIAAIGAGVGSFMVGKSQGDGWGVLSGAGSGAAIGSMFGPMGTAIGAAAGALAGLLGGLIGPSKGAIAGREADARIGQTQAQLLQQFGSVQAIAGMGPAGAELAAAWNSRNVAGEQQFQAKVNEFLAQQERVTALLGEQTRLEGDLAALEKERAKLAESLVVSYADVQRIGSTYKLDLEGLGVAIGQMGTTASFTTIINDLDTLARAARQAGGELDWGGALYGMREEIGALVASALRMGTEVPANMQPFIQNLFETGNLLDENGQKITDISQLKWGAPVETEAEKTTRAMEAIETAIGELKAALLEVVNALKTLLPQAAQEGANQVNTTISGLRPTIRIGVEIDDVEIGDGVPRLGTGGIVRRPTLAVIGEAGAEAVVPLTGAGLQAAVPARGREVGELRWRGRSIADVFWAEARPSAVARGLA